MSKRALRRFHKQRIFNRVYRRVLRQNIWFIEHNWSVTYDDILHWSRLRAATSTLCSCYSCGNPRRHRPYGESPLTLQERRAELDEREQLDEWLWD